MNDTTQKIAAEAAKQADDDLGLELAPAGATQLIAIIQSAIENALDAYVASGVAEQKIANRAAHASEGKLYREIIPQPTTTQNNFGNAIELLTEPPIWVEPLHEPAHASEPWTPQMLSRLFDAECSPEDAIERICSLHNNATAHANEVCTCDNSASDVITDPYCPIHGQLRAAHASEDGHELDSIAQQFWSDVRQSGFDIEGWQAEHSDALRTALESAFKQGLSQRPTPATEGKQ